MLLEYSAEELNERVLRFANDLALLQFLQRPGHAPEGALRRGESRKRIQGRPLQSREPGLLLPLLALRSGPRFRANGAAALVDLDAARALDFRAR